VAQSYAMRFDEPHTVLRRVERTVPVPGPDELVLEVLACGVCRTDLHIADGEIAAHYPIVPGHEVVGRVIALAALRAGALEGAAVLVPPC